MLLQSWKSLETFTEAQRLPDPELRSDEELARITIGGPALLDSRVTLSEYNSEWPTLFAQESERVRDALGDRALRIEHVGSTSVPGLAAKPVIDVLLVVADSADEPSYFPALEAAGYVLRIREPEWHEHRLLKGPGPEANLHVFTEGSVEIDRLLLLRDWLRANDGDRELYARTKRELAARRWKYMQHYADAKGEVIEAIIERARRGAVQ